MEVARSPRMRPRFFRSTSFNPYKISALLLLTSCFVVIIFSQKMREIWNQKQWRKCYLCGFRNFAAQKINHNKENIVRNPWRSGGKEIHQGQLPGLRGRLSGPPIVIRGQWRWERTISCPCHLLLADLGAVDNVTSYWKSALVVRFLKCTDHEFIKKMTSWINRVKVLGNCFS